MAAIEYIPLKEPLACGVNWTGSVTMSSGEIARPLASGTGVLNGLPGVRNTLTVTGRFPVLMMRTMSVTDGPTGTAPNWTCDCDDTRAPVPGTLMPVSGTVTVCPVESPMVNELESELVALVGA